MQTLRTLIRSNHALYAEIIECVLCVYSMIPHGDRIGELSIEEMDDYVGYLLNRYGIDVWEEVVYLNIPEIGFCG